MAVLLSVPGHKTSLWKVYSAIKPDQCPGCLCGGGSLHYVGLAQNYEPGWQAKMYHCGECSAWVDCVVPAEAPKPSQRQRPFEHQNISRMLL